MKPIAVLTCDKLLQRPEGYLARDDDHLLEALRRAGMPFVAVAWDRMGPPEQYRAVWVRTTWDYVGRHSEFLSVLQRVSKSGVPLVNSYSVIEWNLCKSYLLDLESKGVPILPTLYLTPGPDTSFEKIQQRVRAWSSKQLILKPAVSATSQGLIRFPFEDLKAQLDLLWDRAEDYLLQPYREAVQSGEVSLIYFRGELSHAVKKIPAQGDFRVQEEFGGRHQPYLPSSDDLEWGQKVIGLLPEGVCAARVDFILDAGSRYLMELELIEPTLFLGTSPEAASKLVQAFEVTLSQWVQQRTI